MGKIKQKKNTENGKKQSGGGGRVTSEKDEKEEGFLLPCGKTAFQVKGTACATWNREVSTRVARSSERNGIHTTQFQRRK